MGPQVENKPVEKQKEENSTKKAIEKVVKTAVTEPTIEIPLPSKQLTQGKAAVASLGQAAAATLPPVTTGVTGALAKPLADGIKAIPVPDKIEVLNPTFSPGMRFGKELRSLIGQSQKK